MRIALVLVLGAWASARGADISVPGGILRTEKHSSVRMNASEVELTNGTITYELQNPVAAWLQIVTPSVSVKAFEEGVYRITIRKTGESDLTAQSGRMMVAAPNGEQWVEAGQKMIARGPRGNPEFRIVSAMAWWRRLAGLLQNIQIGGGGGASLESDGGRDEKAATEQKAHTKPAGESAAVPSGSGHSGAERGKTSDGHSNPAAGGPHSGDSRPASSGSGGSSHSSASHAAPAPASSSGGGGSSHSAESHAAAANSSHATDNAPKGK